MTEKGARTKLILGIAAHVDAGKTTLAEALLHGCGAIRSAGRVDHGDAFLDTDALEKARGITIFSKTAELSCGGRPVTLVDTPGHVDFSPETERVLDILDACVLVISAADGVQSHTRTLWKLLSLHRIPTLVFVNKMDRPGADRPALLAGLKKDLSGSCTDFSALPESGPLPAALLEEAAVCDEALLTRFLEEGGLSDAELAAAFAARQIFPVFFGSALKEEGIGALTAFLGRFAPETAGGPDFAAKVFKISRDSSGARLTHLKVTGGALRPRMPVETAPGEEEKADQLRLYSGASFRNLSEAPAGTVCAVTGWQKTFAGQGLGREKDAPARRLEPVLRCSLLLPAGCDLHDFYRRLAPLAEEEPTLSLSLDEKGRQIQVCVMGEVQLETLRQRILERTGTEVSFGPGTVLYKETIAAPAYGCGHFEPLRHYAEVHLLLEPLPAGSGLVFASDCREELLAKNWQRLVLTHLAERVHRGVLTGAPVTDLKITLIGGRSHEKHTEGGDFRQATYRAVRQGLMEAESVLLEPFYAFTLRVPQERTGRAMNELLRMGGTLDSQETAGGETVFAGTAPVSELDTYAAEVAAYTGGRGKLTCVPAGYAPCHNAEEVIAAAGYDPESDLAQPSSSVFCAHGAGYEVPWDEAPERMHVQLHGHREPAAPVPGGEDVPARRREEDAAVLDRELEGIFNRTYGTDRSFDRVRRAERTVFSAAPRREKQEIPERYRREKKILPSCLLVDGYNIIFAWPELRELAHVNIDAARDALAEILAEYREFHGISLILVFDAYKVRGARGEREHYKGIDIIYTREAQTADAYIERAARDLQGKAEITVATSDALEQVIIYGAGARRQSAAELKEEVEATGRRIREILDAQRPVRNRPLEGLTLPEEADRPED